MEIKIPELVKLDEIQNLLKIVLQNQNNLSKRWLTVKETSDYIGYSINSIHKMVQKGTFVLNYHYYKKEKKLLFDIKALDIWITSSETKELSNNKKIVNEIISSTIEQNNYNK